MFRNIGSSCVLAVPKGRIDSYKVAGWTKSIFKGGIIESELLNYKAENEGNYYETIQSAIDAAPEGSYASEHMLDLRSTDSVVKLLGSSTYSCNYEECGGVIFFLGELEDNKLLLDDTTKDTFSDAFGKAVISTDVDPQYGLYPVIYNSEVNYYKSNSKGGYKIVKCEFEDPFVKGWLSDGESIHLKKDIVLTSNMACSLKDGEGNLLNPIRLDGFKPTDEESIGKQLQKIAKEQNTNGEYRRVGEIHGFPILMCSEPLDKDGLGMFQNKFCVEGNYKYRYNNGFIALSDPIAAARNFINSLERIPQTIEQYKEKNAVLEKDIPQLKEIAGKQWKKEDELKGLKSELAAIDRKIQLELAKDNEPQQQQAVANGDDVVEVAPHKDTPSRGLRP